MTFSILDGRRAIQQLGAEGSGTALDPYIIERVLVGGYRQIKVEITRPANTTVYAPLDALADNAPSIATHLLAGIARKTNGSGAIISSRS